MNTSHLSVRTAALLLAITSSASAQSKSEPTSTQPETRETSTDSGTPAPGAGRTPAARRLSESGGGQGGSMPLPGIPKSPHTFVPEQEWSSKMRGMTFARSSNSDTPVILTTSPTEPTVQNEWIEDLKVMDKLLRDMIGDTGGNGPSAMGIPLVVLGRATPMYVENCGVIFRAGVSYPLAPGKETDKTNDAPRDRVSAWARAKREIAGDSPKSMRDGMEGGMADFPDFKKEKVDALIAGIIRVLPEASNMRHLQPDEFVFISVSGSDDTGGPARLTLKARKSDIDAAGAGKLKPEEFKLKISLRIG